MLPVRRPEVDPGQSGTRVAALLASAVLLLLWWHAKIVLFEAFSYTSDLFSFIQMSRTWLEGRPFLYENAFGHHARFHAFFSVALFGPLTRFLGAYGLFGATIALMGVATFGALRRAAGRGPSACLGAMLVPAVVLGPVSFWLWDDVVYGWHAEILFLPLGILYGVALVRERRWRWPVVVLICLTREEGPLLALSIHFFVRTFQPRDHAAAPEDAVALVRRWFRTAPPYLLAATILVAAFAMQRDGGAARLGMVARHLQTTTFDVGSLGPWLLMMLPVLLPSGVILARRPAMAGRSAFALAIALAPLLVVTWLASLAYRGPGDVHGILWPARFALPWTAGVTALVTLLALEERALGTWRALALTSAVLALQVWALAETRRYHFLDRLWPDPARHTRVPWLTDADKGALDCLSRDVPQGTPIAASWNLFTPFHRHDLVWPDRLANAWRRPELVVCESHRPDEASRACLALQQPGMGLGLWWRRAGNLVIGHSANQKRAVSSCFPES